MKDDFKWNRNTSTPPYAPVELSLANAGISTQGQCRGSVVGTRCNALACPVCVSSAAQAYTQMVRQTLEEGFKNDVGKPDLSLVSSELMTELSRVREFGSKKYQRDNWKKGFKFNRSIAAALRHIMAFKDGQDLDSESGLTHIGHAIASLEHLLYDYTHHKEDNDDRKP